MMGYLKFDIKNKNNNFATKCMVYFFKAKTK